MYGAWFKGRLGGRVPSARVVEAMRAMCSTPEIPLVFAVDGGADQTVTISVANFTAAGVVSADLNEVQAWQLGPSSIRA